MEAQGRWLALDSTLWQSVVGDEAVVYGGVDDKAAASTNKLGRFHLVEW
jgi:hypothetical protein